MRGERLVLTGSKSPVEAKPEHHGPGSWPHKFTTHQCAIAPLHASGGKPLIPYSGYRLVTDRLFRLLAVRRHEVGVCAGAPLLLFNQ